MRVCFREICNAAIIAKLVSSETQGGRTGGRTGRGAAREGRKFGLVWSNYYSANTLTDPSVLTLDSKTDVRGGRDRPGQV